MEFGNFVSRAKFAPLVRPVPSTYQPTIARPEWPLMLKDAATGNDLPDVTLMVSYLHQEEKGSDVNVGTHLLLDVLQQSIDAAVVVSNDSDLKLPVREARKTSRTTSVPKLAMKEMGSRYLFIVLYAWLKSTLIRGATGYGHLRRLQRLHGADRHDVAEVEANRSLANCFATITRRASA